MFNMVIFGPPGCGKGTQSQLIMEKFGLMHFSTGELFREEIRQGTSLGEAIEALISEGRLAPEEIVFKVVKEHIDMFIPRIKGFLFDGFPRTLKQAEYLDDILRGYNTKVNMVVYLNVPEEELLRRIMYRAKISGRSDDNEETIHRRLKIYFRETKPILDYYDKQGIVLTIEGIHEVNTVSDIIFDAILKEL